MPKAYVLVTEAIHDAEAMKAYGKASSGALGKHGGKVLVVSEDVDVLEGTWPGNRTVLLEFDSVEAANGWYRSEEYQAAIPLRQAAADCNAVVLPGFELPPR